MYNWTPANAKKIVHQTNGALRCFDIIGLEFHAWLRILIFFQTREFIYQHDVEHVESQFNK